MEQKREALVWDLPTRLFHWLMVLAFAIAWATHDDSRHLDLHTIAGYTFLGLLVFRLIWGVVGSHYARFGEFSYSPKEVFSYLRSLFGRGVKHYIGHNPAGSWAIFLLITLGLLLAISGMVVLGGEEQQGLLAGKLTFDQSLPFSVLHETIAWTMVALIALHISGVIIESVLQRENLIGAMFRGTKWVEGRSAKVTPHYLIATLLLLSVTGWGIVSLDGYARATAEQPYLPFKGPTLAMNELWQEECGACHLAFHPSLLPARSWQRLFNEQENHFQEDLMLDEEVVTELMQYAKENSAEKKMTEAAWKINRSIEPIAAPIEITSVGYWKDKHSEINDEVWRGESVKSATNCGACHFDAEQGTFMDSAMSIPK